MSMAEAIAPRTTRGLAGATVLQIVPALVESGAGRAAVDTSVALLRSGARVIVAGEDGPLNNELQGLGGEWVRLVNETGNMFSANRSAGAIAELVAAERIDLVHAAGVGASRNAAAALKKRAHVPLVHSYAVADFTRDYRDRAYGKALAAGSRIIAPMRAASTRLVSIRGPSHRSAPWCCAAAGSSRAASASSWCRGKSIPRPASSCWSKPRASW